MNSNRSTLGAWAWPAAMLLAAQLLCYIAMSGRGFEYTDESFYVLNALYWREFSATFTLFGAYLEAPTRWLGQNLTAMRLLSLLPLLGAGALLGLEIRRQFWGREPAAGGLPVGVYALLGAAGGMYYFGVFTTLRAPSYNLISMCASMLATVLLMRSLSEARLQTALACAVGYGFAIGACGFSKASTGLVLVLLHVVYLVWVNRDWSLRGLGGRMLAAVLGLGLQVALMTWLNPGWVASLQAGVSLFSYDNGGKLGGMFNEFRWDLQRLAPWSPVAALGLAAWVWCVRRATQRRGLGWLPPVIVLALLGLVIVWGHAELSYRWWPWALIVALALGLVEWFSTGRVALTPQIRRELPLWMLLFLQPFAFSFGTSNSVLWHSQAAGVFVVLALVARLDGLGRAGLLPRPAVGLGLACLCLTPLWFQLHAAFDVKGTYRLADSLMAQTLPVQTPVGELLVDAATHADLMALQASAKQAGLAAGDPLLDFTGDGPGRVLAVGARPLGLPWLVGGYPESPRWAERLLGLIPAASLRSAWIFSSPDGPRTIGGWEPVLAAKLGESSHEVAAVIRLWRSAGFRGETSRPITLCLWRPRGATSGATVQAADAQVCTPAKASAS